MIERARRWRKIVGGGMRQAGVIAAAGIVALTENVQRLSEDHDHARRLAEGLADIDELGLDANTVQTNMVFLQVPVELAKRLQAHLEEHGILISAADPIRLVTHLDLTAEQVGSMIQHTKAFFAAA